MAYGARLESVLGESPQGFESPILRSPDPSVFKGSRLDLFPWHSTRLKRRYEPCPGCVCAAGGMLLVIRP